MSTLLCEQPELLRQSPLRDYLLVCDLPRQVRALRLGGLRVPELDDDCFLSIQEGMVQRLQRFVPKETNLRVIQMKDLEDNILMRAQQIVTDLDHGFIVSTCMEIAHQSIHGSLLEVNRLCNISGDIIGIGPRPGHLALDTQIRLIIDTAAGRPLVFVEDGSFTGGTMCEVIKRFRSQQAKINIAAVVLGFAFPESIKRLYNIVPKDNVHLIEELHQPVDWVPDHDFFPFVPNCGRVFGIQVNKAVYPFYDFNGTPFSIPYLASCCPMAEWTGLRVESHQLRQLSVFFLESAMKIFIRLEQLNGKEIGYADLRHARPRVCVPLRFNDPHLEPPRYRVHDRLRGLRADNDR